MANIVGANALVVKIGDRVQVTFEDRGDGAMLPQFNTSRPEEEAENEDALIPQEQDRHRWRR
jgi:hypothetical protein